MSHRLEYLALPGTSPGTSRQLPVHRFGTAGARPKAYLQAALHADELPGMLVLRHLLHRLFAADTAGQISGEIVVVPMANPIGLDQQLLGRHIGRFETAGGENFNRHYLRLSDRAAVLVEGKLGADAAANVAAVRGALLQLLAGEQAVGELAGLRLALLRLAIDADIVLDLHCEQEAVLHLYTGTDLWPAAADLVGDLGCRACLLAAEFGDDPFDEAFSGIWWRLAERFAGCAPVPKDACLSATVELRGQADVDETLAGQDAANLFRFLTRRGVIRGQAASLPPVPCAATPLAGVDMIRSPAAGIVVFRQAVGAMVKAGDVLAELVDPADDPRKAPLELRSRTDGLLFARASDRLVRPGQPVAKVAGRQPLPDRVGKLLDN